MKKTILFGLALLAATTLQAQEKTESKLVVKPSGRILLDAGLFNASDEINNQLNDGMGIPDMRVGFKATYEDWTAKVDIGYAYGKVGMKDVFIEHSLGKKSLIRAGYFVHQYGLQSATSSSFKISMEEPRSNQALNNARLLGVMFEHSDLRYLVTASFFSETDAMKMSSDKTGNQGIGVMARALYRPLTEPGRIFHVGVSGAYESPRYNSNSELNHKSFVLSTTWPTRIAQVTSMQATVDHAKAMYKFTPEVCAAYNRLGTSTTLSPATTVITASRLPAATQLCAGSSSAANTNITIGTVASTRRHAAASSWCWPMTISTCRIPKQTSAADAATTSPLR